VYNPEISKASSSDDLQDRLTGKELAATRRREEVAAMSAGDKLLQISRLMASASLFDMSRRAAGDLADVARAPSGSMSEPIAPLRETLSDLMEWIEAENLAATIVGGVAAGLHGQPRLTEDVDLVVLDAEGTRRFAPSP
jgi:hypothetical protein